MSGPIDLAAVNRQLLQENANFKSALNQRAADNVGEFIDGLGFLIDLAVIQNNPQAKAMLAKLADRLRSLPTAVAGIVVPNGGS